MQTPQKLNPFAAPFTGSLQISGSKIVAVHVKLAMFFE